MSVPAFQSNEVDDKEHFTLVWGLHDILRCFSWSAWKKICSHSDATIRGLLVRLKIIVEEKKNSGSVHVTPMMSLKSFHCFPAFSLMIATIIEKMKLFMLLKHKYFCCQDHGHVYHDDRKILAVGVSPILLNSYRFSQLFMCNMLHLFTWHTMRLSPPPASGFISSKAVAKFLCDMPVVHTLLVGEYVRCWSRKTVRLKMKNL